MSSAVTNFIKDKRNEFNSDVIYIVNILNKIFTVPMNTKNYIDLNENIPNPLKQDLTYDSLKTKSSEFEQEMFTRVCQNISSLYISPMNAPKSINLTEIPLSGKEYTTDPMKPVGVRVGDLTEYVFDKETKKIIKRDKKDVQEEICNTPEVIELKRYFFLKLKLLVYLRSVLNLTDDETTNQWERIFSDAVKNKYSEDKMNDARSQLEGWYDYIKRIFNDVKNDNIDIGTLNQYILSFEKGDQTTKNLCESIIQICDETGASNQVVQATCNNSKTPINIHSVTEDICTREGKAFVNESKRLDRDISEAIARRQETPQIKKIKSNLAELEKQQRNLVIDPKRPETLDVARRINMAKVESLGELQRIPEKTLEPLKRTQTLQSLEPNKKQIAITTYNPVERNIEKLVLEKPTPQIPTLVPAPKPSQVPVPVPVSVPATGRIRKQELEDAWNKINVALQRVVDASKTTKKPEIQKVLDQSNEYTKLYEQESKINPQEAKLKLVRSLSSSLVENGQTTDPLIQKFATEAKLIPGPFPVSSPEPFPVPEPQFIKKTLVEGRAEVFPSAKKDTVCLGRETLLEELNGLINNIQDENDKKLLESIKKDYIDLVSIKIEKIKDKYISSINIKS